MGADTERLAMEGRLATMGSRLAMTDYLKEEIREGTVSGEEERKMLRVDRRIMVSRSGSRLEFKGRSIKCSMEEKVQFCSQIKTKNKYNL